MFAIFFLIFLVIGMPVGFALGISAFYYFLFEGGIPAEGFMNTLFSGINEFTLMAIPFFVLAGSLMNEGRLTERLVFLSRALVGHIQGGLAHVNVVTSMFFAGISGSAVADTSAVGSILIPAMEEDGYDRDLATAITAASSCIGPIIPPSIPMVVYAVTAGVSIGGMFLAGVIPGVILGLGQMGLVAYYAKKRGYGATNKFSFKVLWQAIKEGIWAIGMIVIILGGIFGGLFTATEAAVVAVVYSMLVGFFATKELKITRIPQIFRDAALTTSVVMMVISMAAVFGRVLTMEKIPPAMAEAFMSISDNKIVLLLLLNLFLLFVGTWLELGAAVVILVPVLLPLAGQLGLDPLHFGAIVVINLIIGFITPPLGVCLFVGCAVGNVAFEELVRVIWPFIIIGIILILLITFIPALTTWLPSIVL
ncbi:MAG: TRAP transporter large permease [Dethiobacteria bacterium]|jgi:C4-dicarboxylate transporter DctM subunit